VKRTALLSFMLGATETSKPEVLTGMVMLIDVLLQVLMVTAAPFSRTALALARLQNQNRKSHLLPMDPVVAETAVMTGAGAAAELTTRYRTSRGQADVVRLLTASPTYTFCSMLTVWLVPSGAQFSRPGTVHGEHIPASCQLYPIREGRTSQ